LKLEARGVLRQGVKKDQQVTHTPTENNTPDTDTHAHDKNNTPNPQTTTSHKHLTTLEGGVCEQDGVNRKAWQSDVFFHKVLREGSV